MATSEHDLSAGILPEEVNRFVGRSNEVKTAKQLFSMTRLVTLSGVGGVGKTRLAIQLARQLRRAFADGVCFVTLADLRDPALLGHTVADALGLRESARQWRTETLTDHLAGRQKLIVLDNCEHLLDACAALVERLLRACPGVRVLATSREALGVAGESTLPVPPLPAPDPLCPRAALAQYDSVGLFLDRAKSAVPTFVLTEANHAAVAALCHTLDGLPLALELAAVRLRALSPEQIVERLADRYDLLGGSRTAPARQRTLGALMSWSFELCGAEERTLWMRLSVFSGGIELEAAEAICGDDQLPRETICNLLASLVDKSILAREEHGAQVRYRLLETVRQFGQQQLRESGETARWRRRHRDWYAELVERTISAWSTSNQSERLDRLRRDHPNLRAALQFCIDQPGEVTIGLRMSSSLYFYWLMRGFLSEGRHWIDLMLMSVSDTDGGRAKGLFVGASLATLRGDMPAASRMLDEALEIARGKNDQANLAYVGQGRGLVAMFQDDISSAITHFEDSLDQFARVDDGTGAAFTGFLYSLAAALWEDSERTAKAHRQVRELTESKGESWIWSCSLWVAGLDAWRRGELRQATELQNAALRIKQPLDDQLGIAECLEAVAWINATLGRRERAATLLGAANTLWRSIGMSLTDLPGLHRHHVECERVARGIGERPFQAAYRAGARMSLSEAIGFALEDPAAARTGPDGGPRQVQLTPREVEIAELIARGQSNRKIAENLVLSRRTVEAHVQHLMAKLGFTSRTQVAAWVAGHDTWGQQTPA